MKTRLFFAITSLLLTLCAQSVLAAEIVWTNSLNGNWESAANWQPNLVPGPSDTAIMTNSGVTVTLTANVTVGEIELGTNGGGPVTLALSGQTLALNGPLNISTNGNLTVANGTLAGNSTNAVVSGPLIWTGGSLGGLLIIGTNGTLTVAGGAGNNNIPNATLVNDGTVIWVSGTLQGGGGASTVISNNGLWDVQSDETFNNAYGYAGTFFNNTGTFRKSLGLSTGATVFNNVTFNQLNGVLDVQNGNLNLEDGGSFTGGYVTTNSTGRTSLDGGNFTIHGTVTSSNVLEDGGNLVSANVIDGALTWTGGVWNNAASVTIAPNAVLFVAGGAGNNDLQNTLVTNNGTVLWVSGTLRGGGGNATTVYNYGLWEVESDETFDNAFGYAGTSFNNAGTFRKSIGLGIGATVFNNVTFNQLNGVLDVQNGNLELQNGGSFIGGYVTTNSTGTAYLSGGSFLINGTVTSSNLVEDGGNLVSTNVIVGALTWSGGVWNNASSVTIAPNALLFVAGGSGYNDLANTLVTNKGTVLWVSGTIRGGGGSATTVYNYGLWEAQSDETFNDQYGYSGTTFNNAGTFRKSVGLSAGASVFSQVTFNQMSGVLDVQNGNLMLENGGGFAGGYTTTNSTGTIHLNNGTFTINGTLTSTNVLEDGGNLQGGNFIQGALTWVAGIWNNAAFVTITSNSTLIVAGGTGANDMANTVVTNNGTVAWGSGTIQAGGGNATVIYNYGTWEAMSDQVFNDAYGYAGTTFNNAGIFRKSAGAAGSATFFQNGVTFNQLKGVLDVLAGNLTLQSGGSFTGGYVTTNNSGTINLNNGNFTINGTITTTNVLQDGGNLVATNVIAGALTWAAGVWNGAASVTIANNSTLIVAGGTGANNMANTAVTNNGTVAWVSGTIQAGGGSATVIYNNGTWEAMSDQTFNDAYGYAGTAFNNLGVFRKSAGAGTNQTVFANGVTFNQLAGVLDAQQGNIQLQSGGNLTGGAMATNPTSTGTIYLIGGSFIINGALTSTNVVENGGNLVGTNLITGALVWTAGVWNSASSVTIAPNSTLIVAGGSGVNNMANTVVMNNGTVDWISGTIQAGGGNATTIYNNGVWNAQSDQTIDDAYGYSGTTFVNLGTFEKTAGTNTTTFSSVGFVSKNGAIVEVDSGTLSLGGGAYSQNGGAFTVTLGGNGTGQWGQLVTSGSALLNGPLNLKFANGFLPAMNGVFPILAAGKVNGAFQTATLPFGMALKYSKTGVSVIWNGITQADWAAGPSALHGTSSETFLLSPGMVVQLTAIGKAGTFQLGATTGSGLTTLSFSTASLPNGLYTLLATVLSSGQVVGQYSRSIFVNNSLSWYEGTLTSSQTWAAGTVNAIDQNIIIPSGVTLTIAPGAILKFAQGTGIIIEPGGTLDASGATASNPIIFTSLTDNSVGGASDQNPNSVPKLGDWNGISVSGQYLTSAFVQVRYVIQTHSGVLAENQEWFGYAEHLITGSVTVPTNVTLTIDPGAVIKFAPGLNITVQAGGALVATGTVAQPIVFTSINDESVGVDTNEVATTPAAGDWDSIYLTGGQATFDHVTLSYGAGPDSLNSGLVSLTAPNSVLTISDSVLMQGEYKGIQAEYGTVNITNCLITGCDRGIQPGLSGPTTVNIVNCTLDNNNYGILAHGGVVNVYNSIISDSLTTDVEYCCGSSLTVFEYNDVWSANGNNYSGISPPTGLNGNISANPNFVDATTGDYQLRYLSPCIDAADGLIAPPTDLTGAPRYNDPRTTVKKGIASAGGLYPDMGAFEFVETASSPIDLTVNSNSISGPSQITAGETVAVQWNDVNIGTGSAVGPWHDTLSLIPTNGGPALAVATVLVAQSTVLGPGQTYSASANVVVPGGAQGEYFWQVEVNSQGDIFVGINWTNDTVLGPAPTTLADQSLTIGGPPLTNVFTAAGQSNVFALTTLAGTFAVTAQANTPGTALELFVGNGYVPSPSHFDFESSQFNSSNASVTVSSSSDPTYYVVVYNVSLGAPSVDYTVSVASLNFAVDSVSPASMANAGPVTLQILGDDLAAADTYSLSGPGGLFAASSVQVSDPTIAYATFNLNGGAAGLYSLQVAQPGGLKITLTNAITVTSPTKVAAAPSLSVQLELPTANRKGRPFNGSIVYHDAGDVDMPAPVLLLSSAGAAEMEVQGMTNFTTSEILLVAASFDGPAGTLTPGETWTIDFSAVCPGGGSPPFTVQYVTVSSTNIINYTALEALLRPPGYCDSAWTVIWTEFQTQVGPAWGGFVKVIDSYSTLMARTNTSGKFYLVQDVLTYAFAQMATISCTTGASLAPPGVPSIPNPEPGPSQTVFGVLSADPNAKFATGIGTSDWVGPGEAITYTIDFANDTNATGPAQVVSITDPLTTNLDWSTLQLTSVGFNNVALNIPPGVRTFDTLTQVNTDTNPVTVKASLDPATGVVTWSIQSVSHITGELVTDPLAGFLPPDNVAGQGEGYVTYTIQPKSGLATGTQINNQASIVFDVNSAIATPATTNLLDATPPTSSITALPAGSSPNFTVSWSGQDVGSGVAGFDIYVSTNSGPWMPWFLDTTNTSGAFLGANGNAYAFYSVAYDEVGNVESNPIIPGASTMVGTAVGFTIANTAPETVTLTWSQGVLLQSTNLLGPWTTNTATSPYTFSATNSQDFFKLLLSN